MGTTSETLLLSNEGHCYRLWSIRPLRLIHSFGDTRVFERYFAGLELPKNTQHKVRLTNLKNGLKLTKIKNETTQ